MRGGEIVLVTVESCAHACFERVKYGRQIGIGLPSSRSSMLDFQRARRLFYLLMRQPV